MELKNYSDWSLESDEAAPDERIRKYADYVRTTAFRSGGLNDEAEQGIRDGVFEIAKQEGLVPEEADDAGVEELVTGLSTRAPKSDPDADAQFLLDHYTLDQNPLDPEVEAKAAPLRRYLTLRKMSPDRVESDGVLAAVTPLLGDKSSLRAARKAAVARGDIPLVAIDEEDGTRHVHSGSGLSRERVTGQLDSLVASGALSASDLLGVERQLSPVAEGSAIGSEITRFGDIARMVEGDPELSAVLAKDAGRRARGDAWASKSGAEKTWHMTKGLLGGAADTVLGTPIRGAIRALGFDMPEEVRDTTPSGLAHLMKMNPALSAEFSPEDLDRAASALIAHQAGPAYRADRPGSGIGLDAYGIPMVARSLAANTKKFEEELSLSPLTESQKGLARGSREAMSAATAPDNLKTILSMDSDAVSLLATARASGVSDQEFVEGWLSDPEKYSGFEERAQSNAMAWGGAVVSLAATPFALFGSETATSIMQHFNRDQNTRRQYAQLFGDEFGLGMDILNTVPQVATDIVAAVGTGGVGLGLKTAVGGAVRSSLKSSARGALRTTAAGLTPDTASLLKSATRAGGESRLGAAFSAVGKELAPALTTVERLAPMAAVSFTRSAGGMYVDLYTQLSEDPKTKHLTHEQKHEQSVGYAVAAGIGTALIVGGFSAMNRSGVERLAHGAIRPGALADDAFDAATGALKTTGGRNVPLSSLNYKQAKRLYEEMHNASRTLPDGAFKQHLRKNIGGAWKHYFRTTLKGGWDEGLEETIDTALQAAITESARDERIPLVERIEQYWKSFVLGGAMGGMASAGSQLIQPLNRNEIGMALDARMTVLRNTAESLRKAGSPMTAEKLERDLAHYQGIAGERAAKEAAEREKIEADRAAGIEPVVEAPSEARFDNDMEEGVFLADLDGAGVHLGDEQGTVVIDGGNAYFVPRRKRKRRDREDADETLIVPDETAAQDRILLGDANRYAAGIVTKLPTLPRDENGNYFVNIAGSKQRFRLPTVEEFQENPEAYFEFDRTPDGVNKLLMFNLPGLDGEGRGEKLETNPYRIGRLAARYGLDISPLPNTPPVDFLSEDPEEETPPAQPPAKLIFSQGGQAQFDFVEGKLPDVPAASLEEGAPEPEEVPPNPVIEEIEKGIASRKAWIKKLAKDPARASNIAEWRNDIIALEARRTEILTPEFTQDELQPIPERIWDEAMGSIVHAANQKLAESEYANTGDVSFNADVLDNLVDRLMDKGWGMANPKEALKEFGSLGMMGLDMLEDTAGALNDFLTNPPAGVPEISPEARKARYGWVDDLVQNVGLAREYMAQKMEQERARDVTKATDTLLYNLLGDREDAQGWQDDLDNRPAPEAVPEGEPEEAPVDEDAEPDEPVEAAPIEDRVIDFLHAIEGYQKSVKDTLADIETEDPKRKLTLSNKERAYDNLKKTIRKETGELIRTRGAALFAEAQALGEAKRELSSSLVAQIKEAVKAHGKFVSSSDVLAYVRPPKTFVDPPNKEWGKGQKLNPKKDKFRTKGEENLFGLLIAQGMTPGWKVVVKEGVRRLVRNVSLSEIGRRVSLLDGFSETVPMNGLYYVFEAFNEGKPDHKTPKGRYTKPAEYLAAKNQQLAEEVEALFPETGAYEMDADGEVWYHIGPKKHPTVASKQPGLTGVLVPVEKIYDIGHGKEYSRGVFTNNPTTTAAQMGMDLLVEIPDGFPAESLNPSIKPVEGTLAVKGAHLPGDIAAAHGGGTLITPGTNVPMSRLHQDKAGLERDSAGRARETLLLDAMADPSYLPQRNPFQVGGGKPRVEGSRSRSLTDKQVARDFADDLKALTGAVSASITFHNYPSAYDMNEVFSEVTTDYTIRFNEYRLAQNITRYVVRSVLGQTLKGGAELRSLSKYVAATGSTSDYLTEEEIKNYPNLAKDLTAFGELSTKDQIALLKTEAAADLSSAIRFSSAANKVLEYFQSSGEMTPAQVAKNLKIIYPRIGGSDPMATISRYAELLLSGALEPDGVFRYRPNPMDGISRESIKTHSGSVARAQWKAYSGGRDGKSVYVTSIEAEGSMEGGYEQSRIVKALEEYAPGVVEMQDHFRDIFAGREGQLSWDDASAQVRMSAPGFLGDSVIQDQEHYVIDAIYKSMDDPKVRDAFYELGLKITAHTGNRDLNKLKGHIFLQALSAHISDMEAYQEGGDLLDLLSQTDAGRKAASALVVAGWLPPIKLSSHARKGQARPTGVDPTGAKGSHRDVRAGFVTPSQTEAVLGGPATTGKGMTDEEIIQKGRDTHRAGYAPKVAGELFVQSESELARYERLREQAAYNIEGDLMDAMSEQNQILGDIELTLTEFEDLKTDFNIFTPGVPGEVGMRTIEDNAKAVAEGKLGEAKALRETAAKLGERAKTLDSVVKGERKAGLAPLIQTLENFMVKAPKTRKKAAGFAKELGISEEFAATYVERQGEGLETRQGLLAAHIRRLRGQRMARLTRAPQTVMQARARAQVAITRAERLETQAGFLKSNSIPFIVMDLEIRWEDTKTNLKDLFAKRDRLKKSAKEMVDEEIRRMQHASSILALDSRLVWKQVRDMARSHPAVRTRAAERARAKREADPGAAFTAEDWAPEPGLVERLVAGAEGRMATQEEVLRAHNARLEERAKAFGAAVFIGQTGVFVDKGERSVVGGNIPWTNPVSAEEIGGYVIPGNEATGEPPRVVGSLASPDIPEGGVLRYGNAKTPYVAWTEQQLGDLEARRAQSRKEAGILPPTPEQIEANQELRAVRAHLNVLAFNRFAITMTPPPGTEKKRAGVAPFKTIPVPQADPALVAKYRDTHFAPSYREYIDYARELIALNPGAASDALKQDVVDWDNVRGPDVTFTEAQTAELGKLRAKLATRKSPVPSQIGVRHPLHKIQSAEDALRRQNEERDTEAYNQLPSNQPLRDFQTMEIIDPIVARIKEQDAFRAKHAQAVAQAEIDRELTTDEWVEKIRATYGADINNPGFANDPLVQAVKEWDALTAVFDRSMQERTDSAAAARGTYGPPVRRGRMRLIPSWEGPFASMSTIDPSLRDAAFESNTEEMAALGLKEGDSESMIGALKLLRKSGPPHHRLAADILLAGAGDYVRTVNLVVVEMDNGFAGLYDRDTNSVILNLNEFNGRGLADVLLHELLHGATVNVLANPQTAAQRAAVARIGQLRQMANTLAKKQGVTSSAILHGLESDAEFLTYALTAPEFQNLLKGLALPEQRNVWQRIVDSVMQFFGIDPAKFRKQRDAVEELLDFTKMGMAHRRTFTTDLRWDQHEADRVNSKAEAFNFHADRMAMENDGVFAERVTPKTKRYRSSGGVSNWIAISDDLKAVDFGSLPDLESVAAAAKQDFDSLLRMGTPFKDSTKYVEGVLADPHNIGNAHIRALRAQYKDDVPRIVADMDRELTKVHVSVTKANANYLTQAHADNPYFQSIMLRASFHGMGPTITTSPLNLYPAAVAQIRQRWDTGELESVKQVADAYSAVAAEAAQEQLAAESSAIPGLEGGTWVKLPQVTGEMTDEEVSQTHSFWASMSRKNWCTSRGQQLIYAKEGPMYVFRKDNQSLLAIRFEGDEVVEIQSMKNDSTIPPEYLEEVKNFASNAELSESAKRTIAKAESEAAFLRDLDELIAPGAEWDKRIHPLEKVLLKDGSYAIRGVMRNTNPKSLEGVSIAVGSVMLSQYTGKLRMVMGDVWTKSPGSPNSLERVIGTVNAMDNSAFPLLDSATTLAVDQGVVVHLPPIFEGRVRTEGELRGLEYLTGNLDMEGESLAPDLLQVDGTLRIESSGLSLPQLNAVVGSLYVTSFFVEAPNLLVVGGKLDVEGTLIAPELEVTGNMLVAHFTATMHSASGPLTSVVKSVIGRVTVSGNAVVRGLTRVAGDVIMFDAAELPDLVEVWGNFRKIPPDPRTYARMLANQNRPQGGHKEKVRVKVEVPPDSPFFPKAPNVVLVAGEYSSSLISETNDKLERVGGWVNLGDEGYMSNLTHVGGYILGGADHPKAKQGLGVDRALGDAKPFAGIRNAMPASGAPRIYGVRVESDQAGISLSFLAPGSKGRGPRIVMVEMDGGRARFIGSERLTPAQEEDFLNGTLKSFDHDGLPANVAHEQFVKVFGFDPLARARDITQQVSSLPVDNRFDAAEKLIREYASTLEGRFAMPAPGTGAPGIDPQAELQDMLPPGMAISLDDKMFGVMGTRRSEPSVIHVHPEHLAAMVAGLRPDKARAVIRATLDEELAELAADSVMSDGDYTELAGTLSDSQRTKLEHSYFGVMGLGHAGTVGAIAERRESGQWTDADLGREWFRQHVTRMALGSTREQVLDYRDSNPGLFQKILDAITNYISVLKDRLAASFTNGTAARISQASRELRRLRNDGVLPDPERAPAGEMGDITAFLNALDGSILPGQEDRVRFALPVYGEDAKVGGFWKAVRSRFYDMAHPELKAILDTKGGVNKAVEYTMKEFNRRFPKMRDAALEAGFSLDDIMLAFGTTAPMVSADERRGISRTLRSEGLGWKKSEADPAVKASRNERERVLYDDAARRMASGFRIEQQAMEDTMRAQGLGEMVDFIIENRKQLNKYKVQIGFGDTNDVYLTRTYRYFKTPAWAAAVKAGSVFTDPETGESVDFGALRRVAADEMYKAEVLKNAKKDGQRLTDAEVAERVMKKLDDYLRDLDGRAETSKTMDGVVMLRKDLNLLKTKKDLDFPLRHLLGEVKDPFEVYLRTLHNVSRYASNEAFLRDFSEKAVELGLASYDPTEGMELLFPARKDMEYDKLAGLHVRKDIANAIRDEFLHKGAASEPNGQALITKAVTRPAAWISGASIFAKTSLGVGYWARNVMSNLLLTTAQGLNPFSFHAFKAANVAWNANIESGTGGTTEEQRDHIRRLTELQIVRDDLNGRMVLDLMHGFAAGTEQQVDDMLKALTQAQVTGDMGVIRKLAQGSKVPAAWNWLVEGAANLNNFVDSFPKVNAYYQELASLRKSYGDTKPEGELEALAARKVKLVFPTHSQQLSVVKAFNRSPLGLAVIPFLRWKTEVLRTMVNTPGLIKEEMGSGNPNEVWRGTKRLLGFAGTVGGGGSAALGTVYMGVNAIFQSLAGDDEEDAESRELSAEERADIRLGMPDYKREHDFIARKVGNRIQMVDLTYALPHSMATDLYKLSTEGLRTGRGGTVDALSRYISGEVFGTNIAFSAAIETLSNEDDYGNKITLGTDAPHTKVAKLLGHYLRGTVQPSIYAKGKAILRTGETQRLELILGEGLGGRATFQDTPILAERMLRRIAKTQLEAVALRREVEQGRYFDPEEVGPTLDKYQAALNKNQFRLSQVLGTLRSLGLSEQEIFKAAKAVKLSPDTIVDATNGTRRSWTFASGWAQRVTEAKRKAKEQEAGPIIDATIEWIRKNPSFYPVVPEDEE